MMAENPTQPPTLAFAATREALIEALARRRWPFLWTEDAKDSFNDGAREIVRDEDMPIIVDFVAAWIEQAGGKGDVLFRKVAHDWREEMGDDRPR
jgi:hypothetical protein